MSLNKAIQHGKEKRKPYSGAKAVDSSCRNHGGEDYALNDRVHKYRKIEVAFESQIEEWEHKNI